jgi:hypothetical protein
VLSTNEATASGHAYADVTGAAYEYPRRYRRLIVPGERFVYYRGRRLPGGKTQRQSYFGAGIIGQVNGSGAPADRLVADILDYRPFLTEVGLRWPDGSYVEPGGAVGGRYYQVGVRRISDDVWVRLIDEGRPTEPAPAAAAHASPETAAEVDAYAIRAAMTNLRSRFPAARIRVMPHNNPGFDIEVTGDQSVRYVEVKGTQAVVPRFFISEGERQFADANRPSYLLMVVYDIDRRSARHRVLEHEAADIEDAFVLTPRQWVGTLRGSSPVTVE